MKKLSLVLFCLWASQSFAQLNLDLSGKSVTSQTINPQTFASLTLTNILPAGQDYEVTLELKYVSSDSLTLPTIGGGGPLSAAAVDRACVNIRDLTQALDTTSDELRIPGAKNKLMKAIKALSAADALTCSANVDQAKIELQATTIEKSFLPIEVKSGYTLTIVIKRGTKTWTFIFKTEALNHWKTYYGFTYIPDVLTKFSNYYANQQTGGDFLISKMNGSNKNVLQNVSPTAMFTYRFFKRPDAIWKLGATGGIFYNTEILGAMAGPSLVIGDNITLNSGVSFVQKYKLKGQYAEGQSIAETLDFDQLHDKIWTYDFFISIGFNLPELFTKKEKK